MKKEYIVLGVVVFLLFVIIVALVSIESQKPDFQLVDVDVWGNVVDVTIQNVGSKTATGVTVYLYNGYGNFVGSATLDKLGAGGVKTLKIWYDTSRGVWGPSRPRIVVACNEGITKTFVI